jgi:excisionase family DNA binding protein
MAPVRLLVLFVCLVLFAASDSGRKPAKSMLERLVLNVAEVMDITGLSRQYVYNEIKSGRLRSLKVGRRRLVRVADLETWLDSFADTAAQG